MTNIAVYKSINENPIFRFVRRMQLIRIDFSTILLSDGLSALKIPIILGSAGPESSSPTMQN
jgi:hypothetical protein